MCTHMNTHTHTYAINSQATHAHIDTHTCTDHTFPPSPQHTHKINPTTQEQKPEISRQLLCSPRPTPGQHTLAAVGNKSEKLRPFRDQLCVPQATPPYEEMRLPIHPLLLKEITIRFFFLWNKFKPTSWLGKRKIVNQFSSLPGFYKISITLFIALILSK